MDYETGEKIKEYLEAQRITQREFSKMVKMHKDKLNKILNGKRKLTLSEYETWCYALHVGVDKFLTPKKPK